MVLRFSSTGSSKKALLTAFSNALAINRGTGCPKSSSLKFHAEYLLIKTLFLHEIARRCLFLYQVQVFRISVTGMPFLFCFVLYFFSSHFVAVAAWSGIQRVDPQMIHLSFFITWCAGSSSTPKQYLFSLGSWKKYILGIRPKKIIIPAPFHSKAFVILYKFETSWALIGRLSRGFFAISGASNFKHFKQLFMTLLFGLLTMWDWASLSSLLFCI